MFVYPYRVKGYVRDRNTNICVQFLSECMYSNWRLVRQFVENTVFCKSIQFKTVSGKIGNRNRPPYWKTVDLFCGIEEIGVWRLSILRAVSCFVTRLKCLSVFSIQGLVKGSWRIPIILITPMLCTPWMDKSYIYVIKSTELSILIKITLDRC